MFFDPDTYLERDPRTAKSAVEAARLGREARQRARLCEAMVKVAAERGYGEAPAHRVFGSAGLGSLTFYKLFPSREACFLAALEACAETIFERAKEAMASESEPRPRLEAGLRALAELAAEEPEATRVVLIEARAAGTASREAQQRWLVRLEMLFEGALARPEGFPDGTARLAVGALSTVVALELAAGRAEALPGVLAELLEATLAPYLGGARAVGQVVS